MHPALEHPAHPALEHPAHPALEHPAHPALALLNLVHLAHPILLPVVQGRRNLSLGATGVTGSSGPAVDPMEEQDKLDKAAEKKMEDMKLKAQVDARIQERMLKMKNLTQH